MRVRVRSYNILMTTDFRVVNVRRVQPVDGSENNIDIII